MTYFTDANQGKGTETDPNSQSTNQEDFVAKIVQEKGEQWQDPQALAKGYLASQEMIEELKRQTAELREDLGKQQYSEQLLAEIRKQAPSSGESSVPSNPQSGGTNDPVNTTPELSEDKLTSLIEQTLTQREAANTARQNIAEANNQLEALYGTEVEAEVTKRAAVLGMSKESLQEIAAQSPTAFLKLLGEEPKKAVNPLTNGTVNTEVGSFTQSSGKRNWDYYQKLRRENSKEYYSPAIQNQLLKDRQEQGEGFYS